MKKFGLLLGAILLGSCSSSSNQSPNNQRPNASSDSKSTQAIEWAEAGLSVTLLPGWRADVSDANQRTFTGPNNARFSIWITTHKPEADNPSIEDETIEFYNAHKEAGEEDLRYLEVGGVKGVHYLRDEKGKDPQTQDQKHIVWNAQRRHKDSRQVISVSLSAPTNKFAEHRETLYQLLQLIRFSAASG
jgi:hypothetical protein